MNEDPTQLGTEIWLGGDSDCETCGSSYNVLGFNYTPESGEFEIQLSVGCYGGDTIVTTNPQEALVFVNDARGWPGGASELTALESAIRALCP